MMITCSVFHINRNDIRVNGKEGIETQVVHKKNTDQDETQTNIVTMDTTSRSTADVLTNWKYTLSGDTYILTEYIGTSSDVVIPSLIDGKKVALDVGVDATKNQNFFPAIATSITIEETGNKVTLIRNTLMNVFRGKRFITSLNLSNLDTSNIVDMTQAISTNAMLETIDVTGWDTSNVILMSRMFQENKVLKEIKGMNFNTSKVESMEQMFFDNPKLLSLDVTSFDTSSVNDIDRMFSGCKSLSAIDISGFDTSNVISFTEMFANCEKLEQIDVSRFNTSNATQIGGMFLNCKKVKALDVTGFDTSKIIEISTMFAGCESLEELDVSGFTTVPEPASPLDRVRSLRDMFNGCKSLKTIDLGNLNSSAVLFMTQAFANCSSVQVFDLENFNPPNLSALYNGVKDVFTIADPSIKKPVPTIIINSAPPLSGLDTAIPGRTFGGPLYDANGGELSAGVETARYFDHFIFADKTEFAVTKDVVAQKYVPTKHGSTFSGWYTDEACTTPYIGDTTTIDLTDEDYMNLTLYAGWAKTITFDSQGGTSILPVDVNEGSLIVKPTDPTKAGQSFVGWYSDSALTTPWDFANDTVSDNMTLYAAWGYNVTFTANNGTTDTVVVVKANESVEKVTDPTKTGYTFAGWYKEVSHLTPWNFDNDTVNGNTQLFAKWNINTYTVTYANTTLSMTTVNHGDAVVKPSDPSKVGYTFNGWYKDAACTIAWDFTNDKITANTSIYAKWENITSKLFFDADNGEVTMQQKELIYNEMYGTLPTPTKEKLIFAGWFTKPYGQGTQRVETDIVSVVEDETLYAYWITDYYYTTNGDLRFENGQDSRYVLRIETKAKDFVLDNQNLMSIYDIYLLLNNDRVSIENTDIWVSIKLKEDERNYAYYKVVYVNELGESVEEYIPILSAEKDVLMFKVNHLSHYAIYAWNDEETAQILPSSNNLSSKNETMNIVTGDSEGNTSMYFVMFMYSSLILFYAVIRKKEF